MQVVLVVAVRDDCGTVRAEHREGSGKDRVTWEGEERVERRWNDREE